MAVLMSVVDCLLSMLHSCHVASAKSYLILYTDRASSRLRGITESVVSEQSVGFRAL